MLGAAIRLSWVSWEKGFIDRTGVVGWPAAVKVVWADDTVVAVGVITWLEREAMVPKVVIGVGREALMPLPPAPARLVETVLVTVPNVVTPVVPFIIEVVTSGLMAEILTGVTRQTPSIGTVQGIVLDCPGVPFSITCATPCWSGPVEVLGTVVMILAGALVPEVITLVVIMVTGDLMPGLLLRPMELAGVIMADTGMVLMMVGLVVLGDMLLMPRILDLFLSPLACVVVMIVAGLPSAEVTSFRMVPAGKGPLVWII